MAAARSKESFEHQITSSCAPSVARRQPCRAVVPCSQPSCRRNFVYQQRELSLVNADAVVLEARLCSKMVTSFLKLGHDRATPMNGVLVARSTKTALYARNIIKIKGNARPQQPKSAGVGSKRRQQKKSLCRRRLHGRKLAGRHQSTRAKFTDHRYRAFLSLAKRRKARRRRVIGSAISTPHAQC